MDLTKMRILTEADELFDIDKEVDAQLKRVQKRIDKKNNTQEQDSNDNIQDSDEENQDSADETNIQNTDDENQSSEEDNSESDINNNSEDEFNNNGQSTDYEYDDSANQEDVPDNYEPKQSIPELKILTTLSDSEYTLCNIRILEDFKTLRKNVDSTINNLLKNVTTKNAKQRQAINVVHNNLYDMLDDIDNYIIFKNRDIYEENVVAYLTFLKRYKLAVNIIKLIIDENTKNNE